MSPFIPLQLQPAGRAGRAGAGPLSQPALLKLIFIQVGVGWNMYQRLMKGLLLNPVSGFGKLYLIIAGNFSTIFKVFGVSFDPNFMESIQKPSM